MPSGTGGTVGTGGGASEYVPTVTAVTKIGVLRRASHPRKGAQERADGGAGPAENVPTPACGTCGKVGPASPPARRALAARRSLRRGPRIRRGACRKCDQTANFS